MPMSSFAYFVCCICVCAQEGGFSDSKKGWASIDGTVQLQREQSRHSMGLE